jgi:hypothetical protein
MPSYTIQADTLNALEEECKIFLQRLGYNIMPQTTFSLPEPMISDKDIGVLDQMANELKDCKGFTPKGVASEQVDPKPKRKYRIKQQIIDLITAGKSDKEVAEITGCKESTAKFYRYHDTDIRPKGHYHTIKTGIDDAKPESKIEEKEIEHPKNIVKILSKGETQSWLQKAESQKLI